MEQAAARIVQLIKDGELRRRMGERVRESVKRRFLMTRLLEQYIDLFSSFETVHYLRDRSSEIDIQWTAFDAVRDKQPAPFQSF